MCVVPKNGRILKLVRETQLPLNALVGIVGDMSATCRESRHVSRVSERHPKSRDILGRMSVFGRCQDVVVVSFTRSVAREKH